MRDPRLPLSDADAAEAWAIDARMAEAAEAALDFPAPWTPPPCLHCGRPLRVEPARVVEGGLLCLPCADAAPYFPDPDLAPAVPCPTCGNQCPTCGRLTCHCGEEHGP